MSEHEMTAVVVRDTGGRGEWNALELGQVSSPLLKAGEVLVQVEACSVNRADLLQRRGLYPPPPGASRLLGLDFAGYIVRAASDVDEWRLGDRVFGIVAGGGYGRYVAVRADHLVPVPERLSFVEAAAAAEVFFTAYLNVFVEGELRSGETVLVHGGAGGVGTAAIQLIREANARVIVTGGSHEKIRQCLDLGASHGIHYREEDLAARILEITEGEGVDVILDIVGAPYLNPHLDILKDRGRLVFIGLMGGNKGEIHLAPLLTKRLRLIGSVLRSRSDEEKAALTAAFKRDVLPLLVSGRVHPVVDRIYPVREVEEAHRYMREGRHFGKIVLTWQPVTTHP